MTTTAVEKTKTIANVSIKELVLTFPKRQFIASGGAEDQFIREAGFALQIIRQNPYIGECDRQSLVDSIANVAMTGLSLNPELRLGYLVPRKGRVYFQSSYMGKVDILIRSGVVKDIYAKLVYEKDTFEVTGDISNSMPTHKADLFSQDRGAVIGGYWVAKLTNGEVKWDTMPRHRIEEIKARSESVKKGSFSPWASDPEEMMRKTIINWAFKSIPKSNISDSILKVLEVDHQFDNEEFNEWKDLQKKEAKDDFLAEEFAEFEDIKEATIVPEEKPKAQKAEK